MDTEMEAGRSSEIQGRLFNVNLGGFAEDLVRGFLESQPQSFEPYYTLEEYVEEIKKGNLTAIIFTKDDYPIGLAVVAFLQCGSKRIVRGDFLTCSKFYTLAQFYDKFEQWAVNMGFDFIDGYVHPNIAEYVVRKKGYGVAGVYVLKGIGKNRSH